MADNKPTNDLSLEEIEKLRDANLKFYKEQIPYLTAEAEYSELKARISEARVRELGAKMQYAQATTKEKE